MIDRKAFHTCSSAVAPSFRDAFSAGDVPCYHYGMSMAYRVLTDITLIIHLGWLVFLIAGAYWGRRSLPVMAAHGLGLAFSIVMQVFGWYCPLTHLEFWLRERHDPTIVYPGSFITYYAERLIYINIPPWLIFAVTMLLVLVNGLIYGKILRAKRRRSRESSQGR
jgi:hypothetical protein